MLDKHLQYRRVLVALAGAALSRGLLAQEPPVPEPQAPAGFAPASTAAAPRPLQSIIDEYLRSGLASNLALANQDLEVDKSRAALAAARARFFPELALAARYTRADGGRQIDLPVGQLLNPAYQTLNELLIANGGVARFGAISDQSIPLQLPREQDTRITLRQPLYAPAITASVAAARASLGAAGYSRQAYQRELRRDITVAYLEWLRAGNGAAILAASEATLAENLRVNQSRYDNGKSTHDTVLRARAEWLGVQQQQRDARNGIDQARSYLNFLLNRPLATPLEAPGDAEALPGAVPSAPTATIAAAAPGAAPAAPARPELLALDAAQGAAAAQLRAAHAARRPSVALGVDAGTQGVDYATGRNYDFVTGSVVLNWTLFDAGARAAAISQARLAGKQLANQRELLAARIDLEQQQAVDNLRSARDSLATAEARAAAARAAFAIASKRRDAGMADQLGFLDARSEMTRAELNRNLTYYTLLERQAEYAWARGDVP
jgi:outer membrane protein TolC